MKKAMELSLLCDVRIFLFLYDQHETKLIHYQSDPRDDFKSVFKSGCNRFFYTNQDVSNRMRYKSDEYQYKDQDYIIQASKSQ